MTGAVGSPDLVGNAPSVDVKGALAISLKRTFHSILWSPKVLFFCGSFNAVSLMHSRAFRPQEIASPVAKNVRPDRPRRQRRHTEIQRQVDLWDIRCPSRV
jgi:hypothetical protein